MIPVHTKDTVLLIIRVDGIRHQAHLSKGDDRPGNLPWPLSLCSQSNLCAPLQGSALPQEALAEPRHLGPGPSDFVVGIKLGRGDIYVFLPGVAVFSLSFTSPTSFSFRLLFPEAACGCTTNIPVIHERFLGIALKPPSWGSGCSHTEGLFFPVVPT